MATKTWSDIESLPVEATRRSGNTTTIVINKHIKSTRPGDTQPKPKPALRAGARGT